MFCLLRNVVAFERFTDGSGVQALLCITLLATSGRTCRAARGLLRLLTTWCRRCRGQADIPALLRAACGRAQAAPADFATAPCYRRSAQRTARAAAATRTYLLPPAAVTLFAAVFAAFSPFYPLLVPSLFSACGRRIGLTCVRRGSAENDGLHNTASRLLLRHVVCIVRWRLYALPSCTFACGSA